jgi:type I restriction enzyme R subunit
VQHADKPTARLEHDQAINRDILELLADHTELFKQFSDNPDFKRWLTETVFDATNRPARLPASNCSPGVNVSPS